MVIYRDEASTQGRYPDPMHVLLRRLSTAFAAALRAAILVAALLHAAPGHAQQGPFASLSGAWSGGGFLPIRRALNVVLRHQFTTLLVFLETLALTVLLFVYIPKGFLPTQDTGLITGLSEAAQDVSPEKMRRLHLELTRVIERDPDVATVGSAFGSNSGGTPNTGRFFIGLKPHDERKVSAVQIVGRLRPQLAKVEGVVLYLQPAQDLPI